ncbi:MAG: SAM-dependent chlorinase/fluorinase [Eubacteriales bacterium]|jgi:S-adenosylmethionine hydrolase|nr:SAM-dependent chlorinase/fluorinase [Eubacteriales bacterium]
MKPCIVMQTDFGMGGGAMFGVCKCIDPELQLYDMAHTLPKFNVEKASSSLRNAIIYWPKGTVFVSVVDPGVGTSRRASVAKTKNGYYIVTPDNGSLTGVLNEYGIEEIREIDETVNRLKGTEKTSIFHGRDLFAYCAAKLAAGVIDYAGVGPAYPVSEIVTFKIPASSAGPNEAHGCVTELMDTFGNLETNIRIDQFESTGIRQGEHVRVKICHNGATVFDKPILYHRSFGYAKPGEEILYNSSTGFMGIAMNQQDFARTYGVDGGSAWSLDITKE